MRIKLLLLLCSLLVIGKWASAHDICLQRKARPNPMEIPIFPPSENCAILSNILNVNFDRTKDYAIKKNGGQRSIINIHLFPSFVSVVF